MLEFNMFPGRFDRYEFEKKHIAYCLLTSLILSFISVMGCKLFLNNQIFFLDKKIKQMRSKKIRRLDANQMGKNFFDLTRQAHRHAINIIKMIDDAQKNGVFIQKVMPSKSDIQIQGETYSLTQLLFFIRVENKMFQCHQYKINTNANHLNKVGFYIQMKER